MGVRQSQEKAKAEDRLNPFGIAFFRECVVPLPGRLCWILLLLVPVLIVCVCHDSKFRVQSHFVLASDLIPGNLSRIDVRILVKTEDETGSRGSKRQMKS